MILKKLALSILNPILNYHWKERKISKGNDFPELVFYVIRRRDRNVGLGSNVIVFLGHFNYAKLRGYIPVVDLKNYRSIFSNKKYNELNYWEIFFKQPTEYDLNKIIKAKNIILSSGESSLVRPNVTYRYFTNYNDITFWRSIVKQYIKFSNFVENEILNHMNYFGEMQNKVLGVLARGTDYEHLKPKGHPIQPDITKLFEKIDKLIITYGYKFIFLTTEDGVLFSKFKDKYGDMLFSYEIDRIIYNKTETRYLSKFKKDLNINEIESHSAYISSLAIISNLNHIVCGMTSGSLVSLLFSDSLEAETFDLGVY